MTKKPTTGKFYDADEQALIESIESDDARFESTLNDERIKEIRQIARATINDDREKISLRIPKSDLVRIRSRALREGIPYQTLISGIIHQYIEGDLLERKTGQG